MGPRYRGPDWMQISPAAGFLFQEKTHYDKSKESYVGFVAIAAIKLWLPFVHEA